LNGNVVSFYNLSADGVIFRVFLDYTASLSPANLGENVTSSILLTETVVKF